mmetsp:Transcript_30742/g.44710  ORF Transcript_30742/g.44710 Transcript_30742/m.44710 type:complete len:582 (+) Transcript_30742:121-1866(+)
MRILIFSMEFADPIFSGNGVLARTYATELVKQHHTVDVITSYPVSAWVDKAEVKTGWMSNDIASTDAATPPFRKKNDQQKPLYIALPVPEKKWRKLDWNGPHDYYAQGCLEYFQPSSQEKNAASTKDEVSKSSHLSVFECVFNKARSVFYREEEDEPCTKHDNKTIDSIFIVDWHGFVAFEKIKSQWTGTNSKDFGTNQQQQPKIIFLNFRVFANSILLPETKSEEFMFYKKMETAAMESSHATVCLAETDKKMLLSMVSSSCDATSHPVFILPPALQPNLISRCSATWKSLPMSLNNFDAVKKDVDDPRKGTFLLCSCVRLDPTKNALKFVEIVEELVKRNNNNQKSNNGHFSLVKSKKYPQACVIPFLCGAAANVEYANLVRNRLRQACSIANGDIDDNNKVNCIIREDFVTSDELVRYFQSSILNVHPCEYDAFGMTVSESAACGVLSITHGERGYDSKNYDASNTSVSTIFDKKNGGDKLHQPKECWDSNVGACGLFDYQKSEIILTDFRKPATEIANAMEPLLLSLLERAVECAQSNGQTSSLPDLDEWHQQARMTALSHTPETATVKLIQMVNNL